MSNPEKKLIFTRRDLEAFESYIVKDVHGNRCTIAVRQHYHEANPLRGGKGSGIELLIFGDYGPFHHYWPSCGDQPWWVWLEDTDQDYFLKKITGGKHTEFDFRQSRARACADIIYQRRCGSIRKDTARDAYDTIAKMDPCGEEAFLMAISDLREGHHALFEDYWGYHTLKPGLDALWTHLWRPFIEEAKRTKGFTANTAEQKAQP